MATHFYHLLLCSSGTPSPVPLVCWGLSSMSHRQHKLIKTYSSFLLTHKPTAGHSSHTMTLHNTFLTLIISLISRQVLIKFPPYSNLSMTAVTYHGLVPHPGFKVLYYISLREAQRGPAPCLRSHSKSVTRLLIPTHCLTPWMASTQRGW